MSRARAAVYRALHGHAVSAEGPHLTWTHRLSAALIVGSIVVAILATEPAVRAPAEPLFGMLEIGFGAAFLIEYLARVWSIGEDPRFTGLAGRVRYAMTPYALIDLVALVPFLTGWGDAVSRAATCPPSETPRPVVAAAVLRSHASRVEGGV